MIEEVEVNFRLNLINSSLKFGCWKGSRLKARISIRRRRYLTSDASTLAEYSCRERIFNIGDKKMAGEAKVEGKPPPPSFSIEMKEHRVSSLRVSRKFSQYAPVLYSLHGMGAIVDRISRYPTRKADV